MKAVPYLNYNGNCAEAFTFYHQLFPGSELNMSLFKDMPEGGGMSDPAWADKVMNVELKMGDMVIMASDAPPQYYTPMAGSSVALMLDDPAETDRVYAALKDGGQVTMELQQTFWAKKFAMLTDRFGTPWMLNCA